MNYDPWAGGGLPFLNIASICSHTHALGPGARAAVWVQGCPLHCPGCIAPDWIPLRIERLLSPEAVVADLLLGPEVTGLTFSGGEPMLQAAGLAAVARIVRKQRDVSLICFTGFHFAQLEKRPPGPGVSDLLAEVDVLIDAPYVAAKNDERGLRGSNNQHIHFLTNRMIGAEFDFANGSRQAEVHVDDGTALLVGVPSSGSLRAFHAAIDITNDRITHPEGRVSEIE